MFSVAAIPTYVLLVFEAPTPAPGFRVETPAPTPTPGFSHYPYTPQDTEKYFDGVYRLENIGLLLYPIIKPPPEITRHIVTTNSGK